MGFVREAGGNRNYLSRPQEGFSPLPGKPPRPY
jgi:hypothetical protein